MKMTCLSLPSSMSEASAEKTQSLGLTQLLGTRIIGEFVYSCVWHLGEKDLKTRTAI